MSRKIVTISWAIILTGLLAFTYFYFANLKNFKNNQAIKAVPTDASVIVQVQNPKDVIDIVLNDIRYKETLQSFSSFKIFTQALNDLENDSIFNAGWVQALKNKPLTISLHLLGKDKVRPLFTYSLTNQAEENKIIAFLEGKHTNWMMNKRKYNTSFIYSIKLKDRQGEIFVSSYRGLLMASYSPLLVENALRQLRTEYSLMEDNTFSQLFKTSGTNADANVFINFEQLPASLSSIFNRKTQEKISFIKRVSNWGELDVNLNDNHILVNGFLYSTHHQAKINGLFEGINPSSTEINEIIPDNASYILSYSFDDMEKLKSNLMSYLKQSNQYEGYQFAFNKIKLPVEQKEVEEGLFKIIDKEFAYVICNSTDIKDAYDAYLIIKTKSKSKTLSFLGNIAGQPLEPVSYYKLDAHTKHPIFKVKSSVAFPFILSTFCPDSPKEYFTFVDNYLVFANTSKELSHIIYSNILKKTLDNSIYHKQFANMFSYKENMFIYSDISRISNILPESGSLELLNPSKAQKEALSKFYGIGIQLNAAKDLLYVNACLEYMPKRESEPETIWQSGLDSTIIGKPNLVVNHYTQEKEILVQDKSNMLYLISNAGRILWKKKLAAPILGEVVQIDYYRNNKLQYLFNTSNKIYLLDRNGNPVDKYPVELAYKATNPIAVFDYDNNRNYRIFVACANSKIYLYDKSGKIIPGWNSAPTEGIVNQALQHFRVQGKDYIVFADDKRNYILNRRGENRVNISSDFVTNSNSSFHLVMKNNTAYLSTSDTHGNRQLIDLNSGTCIQESLVQASNDYYYLASDIHNQTGTESIVVTKDKVMVFSSSGKKIYELKIDGNLYPMADIYQFSANNKKIGVFDNKNNKIYLINNDGTIYKNFPLRGKSRFSIGFLNQESSKFNLIVGGENNYLYNYKVE